MCGIAGWFNAQQNSTDSTSRIQKMITAIKHRGPDGNGYQQFKHATLGHVRLSIIDQSGSSQPLSHPDFPVTITFNGEIYNYRELRQQLTNKGFNFKTQGDTEVILALYIIDGIKGFNTLRGMYAFALWDEQQQRGLLVRDPIGIKPLFYRQFNQQLMFASEAKAITSVLDDKPSMDESSLHMIMNFRYIPDNKSLFKHIYQLKPGEIITWHATKTHSSSIANDINHPTTNLYETLADSVQQHLIADVPLSSYLSGGIDSSLITKIAHCTEPNIQTYTLALGDDPKEAQYAAETATLFHLPNQQSELNIDIEKDLKQLIWHLETPKINALQSFHLARFAAQKHKVVLSGLGGDELFLGYNVHQIFYYLNYLNQAPAWMKTSLRHILSLFEQKNNTLFSEKSRIKQITHDLPEWHKIYALLRNVWDSPNLRQKIYAERMLDHALPSAQDHIKHAWNNDIHPLLAFREFEWKHKMVNDLLWHEDRCSMAHGLEIRVPFLDMPLKNQVWDLPLNKLFPRGHKKYLLKHIARQHLPKQILKRPKSGFQVNSPIFFNQHLRKMANQYLSHEMTQKHRVFNYEFIQMAMRLPEQKQYRWHYFILYLMLMTHLWLEKFES